MMELLTVSEVAGVLKVSQDTVLRRFEGQAGVVDLGSGESVRKRKRSYRVIRIPRTVLDKFISERTQ